MIFFPDGDLRPDTLTGESLRQYRTLILPTCQRLTTAQADVLADYLAHGGHLLVLGPLGLNLSEERRRSLVDHAKTTQIAVNQPFDLAHLPSGRQAQFDTEHNLAINVQRVERGAAVHLIRYDFDHGRDEAPILPNLTLDLRLPGRFEHPSVFTPCRTPMEASLTVDGDVHRLTLSNVPLYSVMLLEQLDRAIGGRNDLRGQDVRRS